VGQDESIFEKALIFFFFFEDFGFKNLDVVNSIFVDDVYGPFFIQFADLKY
jgi:hypothetical protein